MKIIVLFGVLTLATPVAADVRPSAVAPGHLETAIRKSDLDLRRASGAAVMLERIRAAADTVCGGAPASLELQRTRLYRACVSETVDRTVTSLDAPMLTARHARRDESAFAAN